MKKSENKAKLQKIYINSENINKNIENLAKTQKIY